MINTFIFDLDGTLGDTLPMCIEAFQKALKDAAGKEYNEEEITAHFGMSEEGIMEKLVPDDSDKGLELYLHYYSLLHDTCPDPFPGIREVLTYLSNQGVHLALVTGKGRNSALYTLKKYGLEGFFEAIETGSKVMHDKPRSIRRVLDELGIEPSEAVYIGDAVHDIVAARETGVGIFSAAWADGTDGEKLAGMSPDEIFHSVEAFNRFIKKELVANE